MDGNNHVQVVSVVPGQTLEWSLDHRGRNGVDTIAVFIGPEGSPTLQLTGDSPSGEWTTHTGQYTVPSGVMRIEFLLNPAAASDGDTDSSHLLDNVRLVEAG